MGSRGPVPKRSSTRRRRNKGSGEVETVEVETTAVVEPPPADESWHPVAAAWYESLIDSGQARFYEPSDWATAVLIAESMSRDLNEQVVGIAEKTGEVVKDRIPLKGASLSAYLKAMGNLLVTEGDRRRVQVELERAPAESATPPEVAVMDEYRRDLGA